MNCIEKFLEWLPFSFESEMKRIDKSFIKIMNDRTANLDYDAMAKSYQSDKSESEKPIADILVDIMNKPCEIKKQDNGVVVYLWRPDSFEFVLVMLDEISKRMGRPSKIDMKAYMNDVIPTKYYSYDWHKTLPIMSLTCLCSEVSKKHHDRMDVILIVTNNINI